MPLTVKEVWKQTWASRVKRTQLILIFILVPIFMTGLPLFFDYIEKRNGVLLNDWVLAQIPAHNVSPFIFSIIWGMVLLMFYRSARSPTILINYCLTLAVVTVARISCIYFFPLLPPQGLVPLVDPLSGVFYGEAAITKDLFFSGHTCALLTLVLCLEKKSDRIIGFLAVLALMILLEIQHIHYTIDILGAVVITYLIYWAMRYILNKARQKDKASKAEVFAESK